MQCALSFSRWNWIHIFSLGRLFPWSHTAAVGLWSMQCWTSACTANDPRDISSTAQPINALSRCACLCVHWFLDCVTCTQNQKLRCFAQYPESANIKKKWKKNMRFKKYGVFRWCSLQFWTISNSLLMSLNTQRAPKYNAQNVYLWRMEKEWNAKPIEPTKRRENNAKHTSHLHLRCAVCLFFRYVIICKQFSGLIVVEVQARAVATPLICFIWLDIVISLLPDLRISSLLFQFTFKIFAC